MTHRGDKGRSLTPEQAQIEVRRQLAQGSVDPEIALKAARTFFENDSAIEPAWYLPDVRDRLRRQMQVALQDAFNHIMFEPEDLCEDCDGVGHRWMNRVLDSYWEPCSECKATGRKEPIPV